MNTDTVITIPAIPVEQPIGIFYVGKMDAYELLAACEFDYRRIRDAGGYKDFLGIQRELKAKRLREIGRYIDTLDAVFPTAVVLSADSRTVSIEKVGKGGYVELTFSAFEDSNDPELQIPFGDIFSIIDGQHRLKSFEYSEREPKFEINVAIFIDIDDATEAEIFSTVNLAQTKVNKSLVYDLFSLAKERSPEKTCHEIVVNLDKMDESPFQSRIKRLGTATTGRFGETLSQATIVRGIIPYITDDPLSDRDVGKRVGFWDPIEGELAKKRIFFEFFRKKEDAKILKILINYFSAVRDRWPDAWESTGTGAILNRTNGFNAFIRFLRPAYLYYTTTPKIVSQKQFALLFEKVDLVDRDFNRDRFVPGSSGATELYRTLMADTGVG